MPTKTIPAKTNHTHPGMLVPEVVAAAPKSLVVGATPKSCVGVTVSSVLTSVPVLGIAGVTAALVPLLRATVEEVLLVATVEPVFTATDAARDCVPLLENCVDELLSGAVGITALPPVLTPKTEPLPPGITVCPSGGPPAMDPLPLPPPPPPLGAGAGAGSGVGSGAGAGVELATPKLRVALPVELAAFVAWTLKRYMPSGSVYVCGDVHTKNESISLCPTIEHITVELASSTVNSNATLPLVDVAPSAGPLVIVTVGAPLGVDVLVLPLPDPVSVEVAVSVDVALLDAVPNIKLRCEIVESSPLARTAKRYDPSGNA